MEIQHAKLAKLFLFIALSSFKVWKKTVNINPSIMREVFQIQRSITPYLKVSVVLIFQSKPK